MAEVMSTDAIDTAVFVKVGVVSLLVVESDMAVIFTKLTGLTWHVVITVLTGLLVMIMVEGERNVMAVLAKGLGRI